MVKCDYSENVRGTMRQGSSTLYFLLTDHLGSTAVTATSGGGWYSELRYYPWGGTRYSSGTTPTSYRYTGQREAEVGLYFYNSRFYDAALGRFVSPDSIIPSPGDPVSFDRFSYVRNNTVNRIDPSGHIDLSCEMNGCPAALPIVIIVLGGSTGDASEVGPVVGDQMPAWVEGGPVTVQYPGTKAGQAAAINPYHYIDYNIALIGYSAGADAALMFADNYPKLGAGDITDIVLLGPTFTGGMPGKTGGLEDNWARIIDEQLLKGTDVLVVNDKANSAWVASSYQGPRDGYGNPAPGTFDYWDLPTQEHWQGGINGTGTNNSPSFRNTVLDWVYDY